MIIARAPLRITLGGGGTDLPSYYRKHEGFLIAGALNKYVFVTITRPFSPGIFLKYSLLEHVQEIVDIKHPIIRESLNLLNLKTPQIEITTLADIPAGTGLGSSGSFTSALLIALYTHYRRSLSRHELAEMACDIEMNKLQEPIGKQDQYSACYGGLTCFTFHQDETVTVEPLQIPITAAHDLEDHLLLFFTGFARSAGSILKDQNDRSKQNDSTMIDNLHFVKELGLRSKLALENGNLQSFGSLMREHWEYKKRRSVGMSNSKIDEWYDLGINNGAIGGKLVGAGGGGFLLFLAEDPQRLRNVMRASGLEEVRYRFDFEGTRIVL